MTAMTGQSSTVEQWAATVLKIWSQKMSFYNISNAREHADRFTHHVISSANGDVSKVIFTFEYFLKFTDMGVGKGIKKRDVGKGGNRKPKPWYTSTFLLEVKKLRNIMAARYANEGISVITNNIKT